MLHRSRAILTILLLGFIFAGPHLCRAQSGQGQAGTGVFFSQGQAVYDAQDLAKSQQAALQDLMVQGATQALGTFLTPEQMGKKYATLQAQILKDPQRYVQSYQIFSENPVDGLYRVVGQVTIDMQALRGDLQKLGFKLTETPPPEPSTGLEQTSPVAEPMPPADVEGGATPSQDHEPTPTAGTTKILWAVAEKGAGGWILAHSTSDPQAVFAMSVLQESQDYGWSLDFPNAGALTPGGDGKVPGSEAIAVAKQTGAPAVVTGVVALGEDANRGPVLKAALQVLDVATGQALGEVHKQLLLQDTSFQEGTIDLAAAVMPELDSMLRHQPQPAAASPAVAPGNGGEWTLVVAGDHRQAGWAQLEPLLREHYPTLEVQSMELEPRQIKIHLAGLDTDFYKVVQELQLPNGNQMQVDQYSPETHAIQVTVSAN